MSYILSSLSAVFIGMAMGFMGGGGGILTVPLLRFGFDHHEKVAIAESLVMVSLVGVVTTLSILREGIIWWRGVALLAITGSIGSFVGSYISFFVTGYTQLFWLSLIMLVASGLMFRPNYSEINDAQSVEKSLNDNLMSGLTLRSKLCGLIAGFMCGILTGFLGVGGGFLLVPVLYAIFIVPMPVAVATSLAILSFNASVGLVYHLPKLVEEKLQIDVFFILSFVIAGQGGGYIGRILAKRVSPRLTRLIFATFLLFSAIGVFTAINLPQLPLPE
jgi:uncharacterized membrane protein YfcA